MANPYSVNIRGIVSDGTNVYVEMQITNGTTTAPSVFPIFPVGTAASAVKAYAQTVANNQPVLDATLAALVNTTVVGA